MGVGSLAAPAGSTLVCFTDGLVEQENEAGEAYANTAFNSWSKQSGLPFRKS